MNVIRKLIVPINKARRAVYRLVVFTLKPRNKNADELSERARRKLDAIRRPDGTVDTSKLHFAENTRTIDEWFDEIEDESQPVLSE